MLYFLVILLNIFAVKSVLYEGDLCDANGLTGTCMRLMSCQSAINDIQKKIRPALCSFVHNDPVVCCVNESSRGPVATTTKRTPSRTTTEYIPPVYDYVDLTANREGECEAIPNSLTSPKTGRKAWDKCVEYQEKLIFPCEKGVALSGDMGRTNNCKHNADELIIGGVDAAENEFPHMVSLGYENDDKSISWECGGALISEKFILTAGHCIANRIGPVTHAIIGSLRVGDTKGGNNLYEISRIIPNPGYASPDKYNDIALLELKTEVKLDQFKVPACLHVGDPVDDSKASTTGWGLTAYKGNSANILQKVILTKFTDAECSQKYRPFRHMKQGLNTATQMCYGDKTMSKDTCQGDSGGPLQIKSKKLYCMYTLVGVTSFGKACGFKGEPGIYTKVAPYVPWIESVVWP